MPFPIVVSQGINGAGKTTTLKLLSGDYVCTAGRAWLGGHDVLSDQMVRS
jgi:ABC-type uncharacterized transport system ATPase subunit